MLQLGEKKPILFEIVLVVLAFLAAGVFSVVGNILNLHPDLSASVGRFVVGVVLLIIYRRAFSRKNPLKGLAFVLPALLFPAWNLFYNLSSGAAFGGTVFFVEAIITAIAPAVFEEVLFRGIFIYNLKKNDYSDIKCLFLTAALFAVVHLTNLAGLDLVSVALQLVYSFVIGLVLAAVYLKNGSLIQIILVHFLIDYTNRLYINPATTATTVQIILFVLLLAVEAIYAICLCGRKKHAL